jgi:hypothetical protein
MSDGHLRRWRAVAELSERGPIVGQRCGQGRREHREAPGTRAGHSGTMPTGRSPKPPTGQLRAQAGEGRSRPIAPSRGLLTGGWVWQAFEPKQRRVNSPRESANPKSVSLGHRTRSELFPPRLVPFQRPIPEKQ